MELDKTLKIEGITERQKLQIEEQKDMNSILGMRNSNSFKVTDSQGKPVQYRERMRRSLRVKMFCFILYYSCGFTRIFT